MAPNIDRKTISELKNGGSEKIKDENGVGRISMGVVVVPYDRNCRLNLKLI